MCLALFVISLFSRVPPQNSATLLWSPAHSLVLLWLASYVLRGLDVGDFVRLSTPQQEKIFWRVDFIFSRDLFLGIEQ
jgi:hypothetical protein